MLVFEVPCLREVDRGKRFRGTPTMLSRRLLPVFLALILFPAAEDAEAQRTCSSAPGTNCKGDSMGGSPTMMTSGAWGPAGP